MTIYIEDNEYANEMKDQLREIVNGDKSLIISPTSISLDDIKYFQVTYQPVTTLIGPGNPDLGKELIKKLANQSGKHIYIHGVQPSLGMLTRTGEYKVIQNEGGGFTTDQNQYPHVDLYVDATAANQRYPITIEEPWMNTTEKFEAPYVRLYHELLHAEGLIDQVSHSHGVIIPKVNQLRAQRSFGYQREEPCFIVSAASGSSTSEEVETLQKIRNEVLRQNRIGKLIEQHVYAAYMRFSPQIAQEVARSIQLRRIVLEIFVEPFIAFLVLTRDYALEKQNRREMRQTIERVRRRLGERYTWSELSEVSRLVGIWAVRLRSPASPGTGMVYPLSWEGVDAEGVLDYLLASINAEVPNDPYIIWAIRPLADMWQIVVDRSPRPERLFIDRVHGWVADLPVPDELHQLPPQAIAEAIRELGQTVFKHDPLRSTLIRRIIRADSGKRTDDDLFGSGHRATEIEELRC
jgi:hypothetical protein